MLKKKKNPKINVTLTNMFLNNLQGEMENTYAEVIIEHTSKARHCFRQFSLSSAILQER
jgi:hypothetical protein